MKNDYFKRLSSNIATSLDWNVPKFVKRHKGDGELIRRQTRRRDKQIVRKETDNYEK